MPAKHTDERWIWRCTLYSVRYFSAGPAGPGKANVPASESVHYACSDRYKDDLRELSRSLNKALRHLPPASLYKSITKNDANRSKYLYSPYIGLEVRTLEPLYSPRIHALYRHGPTRDGRNMLAILLDQPEPYLLVASLLFLGCS